MVIIINTIPSQSSHERKNYEYFYYHKSRLEEVLGLALVIRLPTFSLPPLLTFLPSLTLAVPSPSYTLSRFQCYKSTNFTRPTVTPSKVQDSVRTVSFRGSSDSLRHPHSTPPSPVLFQLTLQNQTCFSCLAVSRLHFCMTARRSVTLSCLGFPSANIITFIRSHLTSRVSTFLIINL